MNPITRDPANRQILTEVIKNLRETTRAAVNRLDASTATAAVKMV